MKKLSICFAFVLMFCLMLSGCTTQFEGTWELSSYLATINNLEFEYTFEETGTICFILLLILFQAQVALPPYGSISKL